ncbi:uncharacterized protein L203_101656 [Cryptococcus depauperatus CBS 7841]|uniref:NUDE domain-containing protein n=1 Tax=Cryptococcus depauperatus CBS 7841 TaxID=1295531 RepID=A0A1E3ISZ0_9TREE|nr:hypothetical protein L203_00975 [Cryptococcus depauperatus CBS 7841]
MSNSIGLDDIYQGIAFQSLDEEMVYYRSKFREALDMLTDTRAELEEFQQSSKELEDEMEQELAANERQQTDLKDKIKKLEYEKDELRSKSVTLQKTHSLTIASMQREMDNLRSERDKTLIALRELEMGNDQLERNERVAVSSLLDLESKYNRAIEEKTLLEQDLTSKEELEAELQRLKDELRDANEEINHLKDHLVRVTSTPPSSISTSSPNQEPMQDFAKLNITDEPHPSPLPPPVPNKDTPQGSPRTLRRSGTTSFIPVASPSARRLPSSPTTYSMGSLTRSSTSRNLVSATGGPSSPAATLARSRSGIPQASPARVSVLSSHQQTKSRGFRLLHDLQARLKATDDKLGGAKVPRRNVSASGGNMFGLGRRGASTSSTASSKTTTSQTSQSVSHARAKDLEEKDTNATPTVSNQFTNADSNPMSPGWVLVGENEDTPTGPWSATLPMFPDSPLNSAYRITNMTSFNRSLSARPGIPLPLASRLAEPTVSSQARQAGHSRPPSRVAQSTIRDRANSRPLSPSSIPISSSRPLSPSLIPTTSRPLSPDMYQSRSTSPLPFSSFSSLNSTSQSTTISQPSSRTSKRNVVGRGPPPVSGSRLLHHQSRSSLSGALNSSSAAERAKRVPRRSSLSGMDKPSGIPAPALGGQTPIARPSSVHVFRETPPHATRIPNMVVRDKERRN